MNNSLNNPDAGKNRVNKSYNTKSNYTQNDNIPDAIMEEDEADVDHNNNISISNISNLFQSKILDMSIVNRSQQRLSPIHINNRKYPIIDYIGTNSNNNKLTDRSLIIGSPTRKNNIIEKSLIQEDDDYKGPLLNILQKASLNYSEELPEFFEKENTSYLVPTDFYKRNPEIKLFIKEEDLNSINQETIYNSLYTKTPLLEIDRFIINELNSKLEMSHKNFQKIIDDYNNPENLEKLPYLLRKFEKSSYQNMVDNDGYNLDKLIKLLNIIKDNCDLESKKIWLKWRIQQLDGICLVLRDNLKMVEEQQRELNFFKNKLEMINYELGKLKKLSAFKNNKVKALNTSNEKDADNDYENEKWEIKRNIILKKYNFDIGSRDITNDKEKEKELISKLKELEKIPQRSVSVRSPKLELKMKREDSFFDVFLPYFSGFDYTLVKQKDEKGNNQLKSYLFDFKHLPTFSIQFLFSEQTKQVIDVHELKRKTVYEKKNRFDLWKLFCDDQKIDVTSTLAKSETSDAKMDSIKEVMSSFKRIDEGYKKLNRLVSLKLDNHFFEGKIMLNRFNGKIVFRINYSKFKLIVLDNYNLFKELSLRPVAENETEYVRINFINNEMDGNSLWKEEMPAFFKDILGWYV